MTSLSSWHPPLWYDTKDGRKKTKLDKSSCIYFLFQKKKKKKTLGILNEYVHISPSWSECSDGRVGTGEFWGHRYAGTTSPRASAKRKKKDILKITLG